MMEKSRCCLIGGGLSPRDSATIFPCCSGSTSELGGRRMTTAIPDLWSNDIKVDVRSPLAILKVQEGILSQKTGGLLQATVSSVETETRVQHQLDLVAPSLGFYRERLLTAEHHRHRYYPVFVQAECFDPVLRRSSNSPLALAAESVRSLVRPPAFGEPTELSGPAGEKAATEDEFIDLNRKVLQSQPVRSLIQSLIARINETAPSKVPESDQASAEPPAQE